AGLISGRPSRCERGLVPRNPPKEPEMHASSHTLRAVVKGTTAVHHGTKTATAKGRGVLLFVLLIAQLMVILDITAVNIALPSLARDLRLTGSNVSWTITSYSLIFGSLLLFGGRAADLLGRRR